MPEYVDKSKGTATFLQVFFVGISMVMAGHCFAWTVGLLYGFWEYFISLMIVSVAFLALCLCLSEMISILPFGGGAYGFARVTMGPFLGFMVGFFDCISNIIYVSLFARIFVLYFNFCFFISYNPEHLPYMWVILCAIVVVLHVFLGKYNFWFMGCLGLVVLAIPMIFVLGTTRLMDYKQYVVEDQKIWGIHPHFMPLGARGFVRLLPVADIFYFGIDMLCLVCEDAKHASSTVPKALMSVFTVCFVLAVAVLFATASQFPGSTFSSFNPLPFIFGLHTIFKEKINHYERTALTILPVLFMEIYALTYAFGRQMCALSRSSLLPPIFSWTSWGNVPYVSLIVGSALGLLHLVVLNYIDPDQFEIRIGLMYSVAQLCSMVVYVISMFSFIVFRYKYSVLERKFNVGILGVPLAIIGIMIFIVLGVSLTFYAVDNHFHLKALAIMTSFGIFYYFVYARSRQSFSQEEQSILFAVYVIKANSKHRTVYRWLEKKYNRYILRNISLAPLAIRTSLRKSSDRTRTKKVTPLSAGARKAAANANAAAAAAGGGGAANESEENVVKPIHVIDRIDESDIHNRVSSSVGTTADGKRSDSSREIEIELGVKATVAPLSAVRLPPLSTVGGSGMASPKFEDDELDLPFDSVLRSKPEVLGVPDLMIHGDNYKEESGVQMESINESQQVEEED